MSTATFEMPQASIASVRSWIPVCAPTDIPANTGVAALVGGVQVAVFHVRAAGADKFFAIGNQDPFTGSNVLSRGIVGDKGGRLKVASPLLKQTFDLETGVCLEDAAMRVPVYPVRVAGGKVEVQA